MSRDFGAHDLVFLLLATRWTVLLFAIAVTGGAMLGATLTALHISSRAWLSYPARSMMAIVQGTPLLLQLFLAFFLPNLFDIRLQPLPAAAMALSLNGAAFLAEIWQGSLRTIGRGQWEAGSAVGLGYWQILCLIVIPQAVRLSLPPTVGFLVQLVKATALSSVLGFVELTKAGQLLLNSTSKPLPVLLSVSVIYFCLCWPLSLAGRWLERGSAS